MTANPLAAMVVIDNAPFAVSPFQSLASDCAVPEIEEAPLATERIRFEIDDETRAVVCRNGIDIEVSDIEGQFALTPERRLEEQCHAAYFLRRLPTPHAQSIVKMRDMITEKRRRGFPVTLANIFNALLTRPAFFAHIIDRAIVEPRLRYFYSLMTRFDAPHHSAFCITDINQLTLEAYVSATFTMLGFMFAGGKRMFLTVDDNLSIVTSTEVMHRGQALWQWLHCVVPSLDWKFRSTFAKLVYPGLRYIPHAYQFADGIQFAGVIWVAFRMAMQQTIEAVTVPIREMWQDSDLSSAGQQYARTIGLPLESIDTEHFLFFSGCGAITAEFPNSDKGVAAFTETATKYSLRTGLVPYLAKCMFEIEQSEQQQAQFAVRSAAAAAAAAATK